MELAAGNCLHAQRLLNRAFQASTVHTYAPTPPEGLMYRMAAASSMGLRLWEAFIRPWDKQRPPRPNSSCRTCRSS